MRRFLLAAAMCGAVTSAQAADLPDLPVLRGSFTDGLTTSRAYWEGLYIGGQAGYGSSDANFDSKPSSLISSLISDNVVQQMGVAQWNLGLGKQTARSSAYGAFVGYNWQWSDVVLGLEASYVHGSFGGAASASKELVSGAPLTDTRYHDVGVTSASSISISDIATFRGAQPMRSDASYLMRSAASR